MFYPYFDPSCFTLQFKIHNESSAPNPTIQVSLDDVIRIIPVDKTHALYLLKIGLNKEQIYVNINVCIQYVYFSKNTIKIEISAGQNVSIMYFYWLLTDWIINIVRIFRNDFIPNNATNITWARRHSAFLLILIGYHTSYKECLKPTRPPFPHVDTLTVPNQT